jgi:hypothetical protein
MSIILTEEILFNKIKKLIPDLQNRHPLSYRDGYSPKYDLSIELKCRKEHYKLLIIEKIKWDKLMEHPNVRYINSTPVGIYSFNLKTIEAPEWFNKMLPAQTEFANKEKINKKVGLLNIEQAKEITELLNK